MAAAARDLKANGRIAVMKSTTAISAQMNDTAGIGTLSSHHIREAAARMRNLRSGNPADTARSLAKALDAWRGRDFAPRRATVAAIAAAWGYSERLLEASFDALLAPFTDESLAVCAATMAINLAKDAVEQAEGRGIGGDIIGMIMPGNLPGAGLHEVLVGLLSGRSLILKTPLAEPFFFASFDRTLRKFDEALGNRLEVFTWGREREDLTAVMCANCDWLAAFGDDITLERLRGYGQYSPNGSSPGNEGNKGLKAEFGLRFSGAYIAEDPLAIANDRQRQSAIIDALALDVSLFEQAGCLSPHHIFVEDRARQGRAGRASDEKVARGKAYDFAAALAEALERLTISLPPPGWLGLENAAALRRVRESARWRALGGAPVTMWEGERLGWTVVYDEEALFTPSPGFRTVTVSPVGGIGDFERRLAPVDGRLEAFAVAGSDVDEVKRCLAERGASYLCAPGAMQSPPLDWRHGGGRFLDALLTHRRISDEERV